MGKTLFGIKKNVIPVPVAAKAAAKPAPKHNPKPVATTPVITAPKPAPKPKFSAEDEARIQAEVDRVKAAKHEQMIAEEIQNRLSS